MKDNETRERFMVLRAQNNSYAAIERELGVTKKTLIAWGKDHREEIENLRALKDEALQEEYGLTMRARVELFGEELRASGLSSQRATFTSCRHQSCTTSWSS